MEKILLLKDNPTFDLYSFSLEFMKDAMVNMKTDYSPSQWEIILNETLAEYKKSAEMGIFEKTINMQDAYFSPLKLTKFQIGNLQHIFDIIEKSSDFKKIKEELILLETKVLLSQNAMDEKAIVLGLLSIAKYSHDFWSAHSELYNSTEGFLQWGKNCLKSDAAGFLGGIVGGLVQGHAAIGMVFGPGGAVCTLAAEGAMGAIIGSGGAAIGGLFQ